MGSVPMEAIREHCIPPDLELPVVMNLLTWLLECELKSPVRHMPGSSLTINLSNLVYICGYSSDPINNTLIPIVILFSKFLAYPPVHFLEFSICQLLQNQIYQNQKSQCVISSVPHMPTPQSPRLADSLCIDLCSPWSSFLNMGVRTGLPKTYKQSSLICPHSKCDQHALYQPLSYHVCHITFECSYLAHPTYYKCPKQKLLILPFLLSAVHIQDSYTSYRTKSVYGGWPPFYKSCLKIVYIF